MTSSRANSVRINKDSFDISLNVKDDFCNPPDPSQRNWILNRALQEITDDLTDLDHKCKKFVQSSARSFIEHEWTKSEAHYTDDELIIENQQVMQAWELPYMREMAKFVTESHGDVLEVGFGMGISATCIQSFGVKSHTIVECNEDVIGKFHEWKKNYPDSNIRLLKGKWQDVISELPPEQFDGIFFDTYPLSEEEFTQYVIQDVTFAQHFFKAAAYCLRLDGNFSYYSNEIDTLSRRHQRELFKYFKTLTIQVCNGLVPPSDCNYWWADSMTVICAKK